MTLLRLLLGAALLLSACHDLAVPEPQAGSVGGALQNRAGPVAGAAVKLTSEAAAETTVATAADGSFEATSLAPGLWTLSVTVAGFVPVDRAFTITSGKRRELGTLMLFAEAADPETAGTLSGQVLIDGADTAQVQGGTVEALLQVTGSPPQLLATTALGASGLFALQIPPGTFTIRVTHPYFVTALVQDVVIAPQERKALPADALVLTLNPGKLTGRVMREVDGVAARVPAPNVTVSASNGSSTTTALDGTFELAGLPGGPQRVLLSGAGFHPALATLTFTVQPGASLPLGDLDMLLDRGNVEGLVEMGDGSALRDVTVFVDGTPYSALAVPTLADPAKGTFRINDVPVGLYSLNAVRTGYRNAASGIFTIEANKTVAAPSLPRLTRVQGDFSVDDGDVSNTPGYTRSRAVTLVVNNPTGVAQWRAAESDPSAAMLPFQPFGADGGIGIAFTLSAGDGEKQLFLQLQDAAGNLGPVLSASIVLDTLAPLAPTLRLGDGTGFTAQANPIPFSLSGSDVVTPGVVNSGVAFMRLSAAATVDGSGNLSGPRLPYQRDDSFTRSTSAEGPFSLSAQLIDNAGNVGAVVSTSVVVDVTAPSGTLTIQRGSAATQNGFTDSPFVTLQVATGVEPHGGVVRVRLANDVTQVDGASPIVASTALSFALDPLADGTKVISYRFVDSAGNQSPVQSASIVLDRIAPTPLAPALVMVALTTPNVTNGRAGALLATAGDDRQMSPTAALLLEVSGVTTPLPPTSSTTVSGAIPFTLPDLDGAHVVRARFQDAAGNVSAPTEFSLTLDRIAPAGSLALQGALADGVASSTVSASQTVNVLVTQFGASTVLLTTGALAACPALSAAYVSLASPTLQGFNLGVANGAATVRGCLADPAGNTTLLTPATMTVDTAAPTGCALQLAGTMRDGTAAPATLTSTSSLTASLSGCTEAPAEVYTVEGAATCTAGASFSWRPAGALSPLALGTSEGLHTVRGCVRDAAHNVGSLALATMTLDTLPPSATSVAINGDAPYIKATQVSLGSHSATLTGAATGATEWAVGTAVGATNFLAFPSGSPRAFPLSVVADGPVVVYARFRDAVGNESYATDVIDADLTPPTTPTLTVRPTGDVGFVNTEVVTVQLAGMTGAAAVRLAEGATLVACTTALGSGPAQAVLTTATLVLGSVEGPHVVCAIADDAAGNPSAVASASVILDKTPPTRPVIVTTDGYAALADGAGATVDIASPSTDAFFRTYQRLGGSATGWTDVAPSAPPLRFSLSVKNDGSEAGFRNELRLRAMDQAGNASAESSVLITADTNAPEVATVDVRWIDNSNRQSTVYWQAPASPDVDHYDISYDSAPTPPFAGAFAAEGVSPLHVTANGPTMNATLSGLANESITYLQIVAYDKAGNVSPATSVLAAQPNEVSPNVVASLDLPGLTHAWAMQHQDGYLYVAGSQHTATPGCQASPSASPLGDFKLLTYDVRRLVAPVQGGVITSAPLPTLTNTQSVATSFECWGVAGNTPQMDIAIEPPWLFVTASSSVFIYNLTNPAAPVRKTTLVLPAGMRATQLELVGDTLFVVGPSIAPIVTRTISINLAKLYDNDATTVPAYPADDLGTIAMSPFLQGTFLTTRDIAASFDVNSALTGFRMGDAVDHNVGTTWDLAGDFFAQRTSVSYQPVSYPVVSGNYAYLSTFTAGMSMLPLTNLWTSTLPAASLPISGFTGGTRIDVQGDELYLTDPNTRGMRIVDLRDMTTANPAPFSISGYDLGRPNSTQAEVFGNYGAVLSSSALTNGTPNVTLLELATPRNFSTRTTVDSRGFGRPEVRPGFAIVPGRPAVYDLHSGDVPVLVPDGTVPADCQTGVTFFGDLQVVAMGTNVRITNLEPLMDRNAATVVNAAATECTGATNSNDYCVTHPVAGTRVLDVAAWGNYLVLAELRASGQQLWVEVFDARTLKDRSTATPLSLASPVASLLAHNDAVGNTGRMATLEVTQGFAVMTFQDNVFNLNTNGRVVVVDLRAAFDDAPLTTLSASSVQADFLVPNTPVTNLAVSPRMARLSGDTLYVASNRGLWAFPAAAVTDNTPATTVSGAGATVVYPDHAFDDLAVNGSSVIVAPGEFANQIEAIAAFDTSSSPTTLKPSGYALFPYGGTAGNTCQVTTDSPSSTFRKVRGGITVNGAKAYVRHPSTFGKFRVIQLE